QLALLVLGQRHRRLRIFRADGVKTIKDSRRLRVFGRWISAQLAIPFVDLPQLLAGLVRPLQFAGQYNEAQPLSVSGAVEAGLRLLVELFATTFLATQEALLQFGHSHQVAALQAHGHQVITLPFERTDPLITPQNEANSAEDDEPGQQRPA